MKELIENSLENIQNKNNYNKKYSRIYRRIHKYWARKPWYIVEEYIKKYSLENDLIMDPFCGSGLTGLESIINNRNFIGHDLNPASIFISKGTLKNTYNIDELKKEFEKIKKMIKKGILDLYKSNEDCPYCNHKLHYIHIVRGPKYEDDPEGKLYCPNCNKRKAKKTRSLNKNEFNKLKKFDEMKIPYWYPKDKFPKNFYKDRFSYKGISRVSDMYTKRNLYALSYILNIIHNNEFKYKDLLMIAFSNSVLHASILKGKNIRPLGVNNYWIPGDYIEENVYYRFSNRLDYVLSSKNILKERIEKKEKIGDYNLSIDSVTNLEYENEIDYVFTDPPYGDAIQFSELSYIWNSWLKKEYDIEKEVIINPKQNKGEKEYNELLRTSLNKIKKSLKYNGYFTLCFQNKKFSIWKNIIKTCKELNFKLIDVRVYDTFGSSYTQNWAEFSPKADIYVTFQKTKENNINNFNVSQTLSLEIIIEEIITYIKSKNIEIDFIKIYDITVSILIWMLYFKNDDNEWFNEFNIKKFKEIASELI